MKLHIFEGECKTSTQSVVDTICGVTILIGMFALVHVLFAYNYEIIAFFTELLNKI